MVVLLPQYMKKLWQRSHNKGDLPRFGHSCSFPTGVIIIPDQAYDERKATEFYNYNFL